MTSNYSYVKAYYIINSQEVLERGFRMRDIAGALPHGFSHNAIQWK